MSFFICIRHIDGFDPARDIEGVAPHIVHSVKLNAGSHVLALSTRFRANQNQIPLREIVFLSPSDTDLYWIQNRAGAMTWPVKQENVATLLSCFNPN